MVFWSARRPMEAEGRFSSEGERAAPSSRSNTVLPKSRRLRRKDFTKLFDRGRTARGRYFIFKYADGTDDLSGRFGFSVSKKVFKRAVDRNKARRRGYTALRMALEGREPRPFGLFILNNNKMPRVPETAEMAEDLTSLLHQAHIV